MKVSTLDHCVPPHHLGLEALSEDLLGRTMSLPGSRSIHELSQTSTGCADLRPAWKARRDHDVDEPTSHILDLPAQNSWRIV
jgi:hypothetical protein